jgi:hypothetical protein
MIEVIVSLNDSRYIKVSDVAEASVEIGRRLFPGKIVRILKPKTILESTSSEIKILQESSLLNSKKYLTMKRGSLYIGCKS